MEIGFIGAGAIATALAGHLVGAGHQVTLSNRRGPDSLAGQVAALGPLARPGTRAEAAAAEMVFLSVMWGDIDASRPRSSPPCAPPWTPSAAARKARPAGRPAAALRCQGPLMLDHVIIQADDLGPLGAFYDQVVAVLNGRRTMDAPALIGYGGHDGPTRLYFSAATDAGGRQAHIALAAASRDQVDAARALAGRLGAVILHETREWPEYHPGYYAVFLRDPAGNNLEIVCHGHPQNP